MTVISCLCYVAAWQVIYYRLAPDFFDKYVAFSLAQKRAAGASDAEIAASQQEMTAFKQYYDQPLINGAITFIEPFPVALLITVVSAALLRRKAGA